MWSSIGLHSLDGFDCFAGPVAVEAFACWKSVKSIETGFPATFGFRHTASNNNKQHVYGQQTLSSL